MRITLKDYQEDAVAAVLDNLAVARGMWHSARRPSSFALSATTGAGKTVMAAAVIEALFEGSDTFDVAPDPGAVVLWFTDDPSLNEQTRSRLMEATDLASSRLHVIQPSFNQSRLEPGNVYFLNAQKLSKNSSLVRGADEGTDEMLPGSRPAADLRGATFWDVLRTTIADDRLTLYLILDEAHKGMKAPTARQANEKQTIVRRLINGEAGAPPIPIVWGISATVQRFTEAMEGISGRSTHPSVEVDPVRVQASGLLKDDIRLDFPAEAGQFDTTLLTRAVRRLREATEQWQAYAAGQEPPLEPVVPLLVVQVPNQPSDELLVEAFRTVQRAWPELPDEALAHVFGDHATIELGGFSVPHVAPERVQDDDWIRVLFAKDAISTGWDCPRAEVLLSYRPAQDETHITQLLGRMVRTPLARRVEGSDRLNSVECLLPRFNRETATHMAEVMLGHGEGGGSGGGQGRRVLFAPVDLLPNPTVPEAVWEAFDALPSQTLPRKEARPIKRLLALAQELSYDRLRPGAVREAHQEMCRVLDGQAARRPDELAQAKEDVGRLDGESLLISAGGMRTAGTFHETVDLRAVDADYAAAGRVLTKSIAAAYAEHVAGDDDDFYEAHLHVAALAKVPGVLAELDREAERLAETWLAAYRVGIKSLSDDRQAAYAEIRAMTPTASEVGVLRPLVRSESTQTPQGRPLPTRPRHLMSDEDGQAPVDRLNVWERRVLDTELARPDALAWYRNPDRGSADALAVAYQRTDGRWKQLYPDFLFFHGTPEDVKVSIVDPHGTHLEDALPKLRGLAAYAERYAGRLHRIEAVAEVDDRLRVLDLTDPDVREQVDAATDIVKLYASRWASDYETDGS